MNNISCRDLTVQIYEIKSLREQIGFFVQNRDGDKGKEIQSILEQKITELKKLLWPCEINTRQELVRQLDEWQTIYTKYGLTAVSLPTAESLMKYLSEDPEFAKLLATKEKQGFTQMVIAPLELKNIINALDAKVQLQGGTERLLSDIWDEILQDESQVRYFGIVKNDKVKGGYTLDQIRANPSEFGILDNCLISFSRPRENILKKDEADDSTDRAEIRCGRYAQEYQDNYFSDTDPHHQDEQAMIPQEWLALFAKDFYNKYLKDNHRIDAKTPDRIDTATWFISTSITGRDHLLSAYWASADRRLRFIGSHPLNPADNLAPRSAIRKSNPHNNQPK